MTPEQQQAASKLTAAIKAKFPGVNPVAEEGPMGVALKLGVPMAQMMEIETAVQDVTTEIMLENGVLVTLLP